MNVRLHFWRAFDHDRQAWQWACVDQDATLVVAGDTTQEAAERWAQKASLRLQVAETKREELMQTISQAEERMMYRPLTGELR